MVSINIELLTSLVTSGEGRVLRILTTTRFRIQILYLAAGGGKGVERDGRVNQKKRKTSLTKKTDNNLL